MVIKLPQLVRLSSHGFQFCALKFGFLAHLNIYSTEENMMENNFVNNGKGY